MPSTDLQTRVILSAEDRGITYLMNRLKTESDLFIDKFSQLGGVISSALGNIGVGYGVKKAMEQIDTLRMDINQVAVTLTDTVKGSSTEIQQAFQQNQKHAEAFFRLLRRQANESISDFTDLRRAYTIMASNGMGIDATKESVQMLANVVDRIKLVTRGQNSNIQVMQEMRALLRGTMRPSDEMARIFQNRDANFSKTIKELVAKRDSKAILEYLNSLLSDIDVSEVVNRSMSKQIGRVKTEVAIWAEDAFTPMYDVFVSMLSNLADSIMNGNNPFFKGLDSVTKTATRMLVRVRDGIKSIDFKARAKEGTDWLAVITESIPKLAAIGLAAKTTAVSMGLMAGAIKSSIAAMNTIPGFITAGAMGYAVAQTYADTGKAPRYADQGHVMGGDDWIDRFKYGLNIVLETVKQSVIALMRWLTEWIPKAVQTVFYNIMESLEDLCEGIDRFIFNLEKIADQIGVKFNIGFLKGDVFEDRRRQGIEDVYHYIVKPNAYTDKARRSNFELLQIEGSLERQFMNILDNVEKRYRDRMNADIRKQNNKSLSAVTGNYQAVIETGGVPTEVTRRYKHFADDIMRLSSFIEQIDASGKKTGVEGAVGNALARYRAIANGISGIDLDLSGLPRSYQEFETMREMLEDFRAQLKKTTDESEKAMLSAHISSLSDTLAEADKKISEDLEFMRSSRLSEAREKLAETMRDAEKEARRTYFINEADKAEQNYFSLSSSSQGEIRKRIRELSGKNELETEAEAVRRKLEYEEKYNALRAKEIEYLKEQDRLMSSGGFFDAIKFSVNEYVHDAKTSFDTMVEFANEAGQAIQSTFSDSLYHVFRGDLNSMKDIFASFCDSLLKSWTDMLAKMVVQQAANGLTSSVFGNLLNGFIGGIFGGGAGMGGLASAGGGSIGAGSTMLMQTMPLMANGGVLRGGFRAFAGGGIATRPTLGLVGEGRYNEAVVPLPDGRSIPVIQKGGGANVIVNITDKSGSATSKTVNQRTDETGATVLDVVIDAIGSNRKNFRNILRSVNA